jgi:hypothetical protein
VAATAVTTNGDVSLQLWTTSEDQVYELTQSPESNTSTTTVSECSDTYEPGYAGWSWATVFGWYFHSNTTPSGNDVGNVETDLLSAASHIVNEYNNCGRAKRIIASESYWGRLQQGVNIDNSAHCLSRDGKSIVGFGTLPSGYIAYTCTWYTTDTRKALESDARMNKGYAWITDEGSGCKVAYNVDNLMTHERGHTFGMADVYDSNHSELTMYGYSSSCEKSKETLALGDMLRLEGLYPN